MNTIEQILDLARWSPSGDNTQPWRFEIFDDLHVIVHGFDTRDHCVYDLRGHASQISIGAMLETMKIAATKFGLSATITRRTDASPVTPTFDVQFARIDSTVPDALAAFIEKRTTQRRPMKIEALSGTDREQLEHAAGPGYNIIWWTSAMERFRIARLLLKNARLRLITPEAFEVHRSVIEWRAQFSQSRIPDQALGQDPISLRITRWAMGDWRRMNFVNSIPGGTVGTRFQLDFLPSLRCAGHFAIIAAAPPSTIDDFIEVGKAVQRVWLALTALGRWQQPEMTPLIFGAYIRDGVNFTREGKALNLARALKSEYEELAGVANADRAVWMGRFGTSRPPGSRSVRLPLSSLRVDP